MAIFRPISKSAPLIWPILAHRTPCGEAAANRYVIIGCFCGKKRVGDVRQIKEKQVISQGQAV